MKKIIVILFFLAITVLGVSLLLLNQKDKKNLPILSEINESDQETKEKVFLIINKKESDLQELEFNFEEGMTAFDLLKRASEDEKFILKTNSYDIGIFVETIGEIENGQDGKYWMYYVNNQMPSVAADKYEIKPRDKVEFKFEESPF